MIIYIYFKNLKKIIRRIIIITEEITIQIIIILHIKIAIINNPRKEDENKYYKVQVKRKQLSKFYHNIGLKKYHYGYGKIQTTDKTNNHKYTEIYGTSGTNNENTNNKRNIIRINYEFTNNKNNSNYNNSNGNEKYNNHRFSNSNDFTRTKNTQINSAGKNDSEAESKILKETYNTRLIEVKSPSKEKNYRYTSNYYLNDTKKNLFNSYQRRTEYNGQNNNKNLKKIFLILIKEEQNIMAKIIIKIQDIMNIN